VPSAKEEVAGGGRDGLGSRRLVVVSRAHRAFSPRTERAGRVCEELRGLGWDCVRWPQTQAPGPAVSAKGRPVRRRLRELAERHLLLDRFEPLGIAGQGALRRLRADAGYLVSPMISPSVIAAKVFRSRGVPYVLDTGDPWEIDPGAPTHGIGKVRVRKSEEALFRAAAGIVVTTGAQATSIEARFPGIPLLIRPNGFQAVAMGSAAESGGRDPEVLRLVHFGRFDPGVRLGPLPFLEALADSGRWSRVVLTQFGPDRHQLPEPGRPDVAVEARELVPWSEAVREAGRHDAALVIGNLPERKMQLPSKAIEYLGLPVPRIALCSGTDDALYRHAVDLPGYLVLTSTDGEAGPKVAAHLGRGWDPDQLRPPESESWDSVAPAIAVFVDSCLRSSLLETGDRSPKAGDVAIP
jgi:hypothetical protein